MIKCKYDDRSVPIYYSMNLDFKRIPEEFLVVCLIEEGYGVLEISNNKCFIGSNVILCLDDTNKVNKLFSGHLKASTLAFSPRFININLDWSIIKHPKYQQLCKIHNYPSFNSFLINNEYYIGILPVSNEMLLNLKAQFDCIVQQLEYQPDNKWSCRSRTILFNILDNINHISKQYLSLNFNSKDLIDEILDYIHINYRDNITINDLCNKFYTNHTTLNKLFKRINW